VFVYFSDGLERGGCDFFIEGEDNVLCINLLERFPGIDECRISIMGEDVWGNFLEDVEGGKETEKTSWRARVNRLTSGNSGGLN
jgi:hypothetical protein